MPKPSIAAVQGKCIAAGLMLCWPCDLIVAADNAQFSDPVLFMGISGVEYARPHVGTRAPQGQGAAVHRRRDQRATEAAQLGMVNKVVPLDELMSATMEMAEARSRRPTPSRLRMAKRAVNHTIDVQGFTHLPSSACFDIHHFGHTRARVVTGGMPSLAGLSSMKDKQSKG